MIRGIIVLAWTLFFFGLVQLPHALAQPCSPSVSPEFDADPLDFASSSVNAFIDFNDGTGFKTYACGSFRTAGGLPANTVARWTGTEWQAVGEAPVGTGKCFAIFNNALYMGGSFGALGDAGLVAIHRWTGTQWVPVTSGPRGGSVNAMTVWDDGSGPALYAVGNFSQLGSTVGIRAVAKFNGTTWSAVGPGLPSTGIAIANAVIGYDDGQGPALYVGGQFGPSGSSLILRWDRVSWNSNTGPSGGFNTAVTAFQVFTDTQGPALWAAAAPVTGSAILYRYGPSRVWSPVNIAVADSFTQALSLAVYNDGTGTALYLGGQFVISTSTGLVRNLAKYNGTTWSRVGVDGGSLSGPVTALAVRTGSRVGLVAGGLVQIGTRPVRSVAMWNGTDWLDLDSGLTNPGVLAFDFVQTAASEQLHAIGGFLGTRAPHAASLNHAARWTGTQWEALGTGINNARYAVAIGSLLYAGGTVNLPGQPTQSGVALWDGSSWSLLPSQIGNFQVVALTAYDDGSGPVPCVAVRMVAGSPAVLVLRNNTWQMLGTPFSTLGSINFVKQLADGALYAAGSALQGTPGGPSERAIAKWDGTQWVFLPPGLNGSVMGVELFDGSLFACGALSYFDTQFIIRSATLARLDGSSWTYLTAGKTGTAQSMAAWNDGSGDALYVGGNFTDSTLGIVNLARFRNGLMESYAGGANAPVQQLSVHNHSLFAGGAFSMIGTSSSPGIARFVGCPPCVADFDNGGGLGTRDGGVTIDDLLYYINLFAAGTLRADLDDGSATGNPDGGVTIDDLIFYLGHYEAGC